ncbi:MAG: hypothetical protein BWX88_04346 [Planctomycetes bacterium ADurb.Bin126]|nr:MAG: hypothetical protein BWX88_04346 [Planctomycetes bacterium ADurb.Bin126]
MKVTNETWQLSDFLKHRATIEAQPVYQRGPVWPPSKRRLLIDSILRGLDVPKIYLHSLAGNPVFKYQIVDGQQRLTSIWEFTDGGVTLELPDDLSDATWAGCAYADLSASDRRRFRRFELIVAVVQGATDDEIRDLFARLQMGERLTPAELRNSIKSALGTEVRNIAENHAFFRHCTFSKARYKHHDLAAHAFALQIHKGKDDLKAPNLRSMYLDFADNAADGTTRRVSEVLTYMHAVQQAQPAWIDRKWGFVDLYLLISLTPSRLLPDPDVLAASYRRFEEVRRAHVQRPEALLEGRNKDKQLFQYIKSFQLGGGISANVLKRHQVLKSRIL